MSWTPSARDEATLPRLGEVGMDPLVLAFAVGVSLFSGFLFGLIPVWKYAGPRVATALLLLIGSGLMIRTFQRVMRMNHEILDKLAGIPGVISVAFADSAPLEGFSPVNSLYTEDKTLQPGQVPRSRRYRLVAPGFFQTMGTRLIPERDFTWADLYRERHVAIISENLAREVSVLLIVAAVLASYLPARRAMAADPVQALRAE